MPLIWARVDAKLIHGQVCVAWTPHLGIDGLVVADHDLAADAWAQKIMMMALPPELSQSCFSAPEAVPEILASKEWLQRKVLLIFKDLWGVVQALAAGLDLKKLNLGNQARLDCGRVIRLADCFYVNEAELDELKRLYLAGVELIIQSVPSARGVIWRPSDAA